MCAPVHDAVLIIAPLDRLHADTAGMQDAMREASRIVLNGFELNTDAHVVRYPDRFMDERGTVMWRRVMSLLEGIEGNIGVVASTTGCCISDNTSTLKTTKDAT